MPNKLFLETYPLYRKFETSIPRSLDDIPAPNLNFHCPICDFWQTYVITNKYYDWAPYANMDSRQRCLQCVYVCVGCQRHQREFFVYISEEFNSIEKVGQFPSWEIKGDKNIEKMLGDHKAYLSRGLISEAQGYGIGAFAYYRRIVEEVIDQLIEDTVILIPDDEKPAFEEAVEQVRATRQASEKIALVKDLLPSSLQVDEMNPLGILHSALSEGLHAESDDECMSNAQIVRESLIYLAREISERKRSKAEFTDKMRGILKKKSAKEA